MTTMVAALYCAAGCSVLLLFALLSSLLAMLPSVQSRRMLALVRSNRPDRRQVGVLERWWKQVQERLVGLSERLGLARNPALRKRLERAGVRDLKLQRRFHSVHLALPFAGAVAGLLISQTRLLAALGLAVVGWILPAFWLRRRVFLRRKRLRRSIPDTVDLLAICVEAGLGLDQAMLRVSTELLLSHPELSEELTQVNLEQRAGRGRLEAWAGLAERTEIAELQSFSNVLAQSDRFGTPIVRALQEFAAEIRTARRQRAEEAAAKTKVKIVFPLVLFIFPCVFIVLLAPALIGMGKGFSWMGL